MTIAQALEKSFKILSQKKINSARLDAEVLLAFILKTSREKVLTHLEKKISTQQIKKFQLLIERRAKYEPIAYLIGYKFFYGLPIKVSSKTLIPRPETEQLIDLVIDYIKDKNLKNSEIKIIDIGTGSGCISLAFKKLLPQAKIYGLESSTEALNLARQNSKNLNLSVIFKKSNLLTSFKEDLNNFIVVANLPYLDKKEIKNFSIEIKRGLSYEPTKALFAGYHGLMVYKNLFKQLNKRLELPQAIFIEINSNYWYDFFKLAKQYFSIAKIDVIKDLCGKKRFIKIIL